VFDIPAELMMTYVLTCVIMESTPGPNMAFLSIVSAGQGRKYGYATVAGIALGLALLGIIAATGMASMIGQSPLLYHTLRWAGIGYLLWLAFEGWRDAGESSVGRTTDKTPMRSYFRHGLFVNLLNPKAAAFYVTVLPTFLSRSDAVVPQAILLTLISVAIATAAHIVIVLMAGTLQAFITTPARNRTFRRIMAVLLAVVAVWFGWATRG